MEDKLEEFNKLVAVQNYRYAMDGFYEPDGSTDSSVDEIWKFIKDNYISKEEVEKVLRWYINNENMLSHEHKDGTYIEYVISEYNKLNQLT